MPSKPQQGPAKHEKQLELKRTVLRFSPTAWAKLLFFRDRGGTEIGGFGITAADDPLHVEQFATVQQETTIASILFSDEAVADFFDKEVDAGCKPEQFARIWLHTHPGESPQPSGVDEETFQRIFGCCQWAVMFVLGTTGKTYARLRFNAGPGGAMLIPVEVDYTRPFAGSDHGLWEAEYRANVRASSWFGLTQAAKEQATAADPVDPALIRDWIEDLEAMEPDQRQIALDELVGRPDLWDEDTEVFLA